MKTYMTGCVGFIGSIVTACSLIREIESTYGKNTRLHQIDKQRGNVQDTWTDTEKAKKVHG